MVGDLSMSLLDLQKLCTVPDFITNWDEFLNEYMETDNE